MCGFSREKQRLQEFKTAAAVLIDSGSDIVSIKAEYKLLAEHVNEKWGYVQRRLMENGCMIWDTVK